MEAEKEKFIEALGLYRGIISLACASVGISRTTYYRWYNTDNEFKEKAEDITEMQVDYVESKLLSLIDAGDTTATIFYLKTKGKSRGYNEKVAVQKETALPVHKELPEKSLDVKKEKNPQLGKRINARKAYIIKLLKDQGKYTVELTYQVKIAAQLLAKTDMLAEEIFSEKHAPINVEYSREGNERESISPKEKLYLDFSQQAQKALRALGMNTDGHERKTNADGLNDLLNLIKEENDE